MSDPDLAEYHSLFETARESAFRLETLPVYTVPSEAKRLGAFLEGRPLPPRSREYNDWIRLIADTTAAGRRWYRVHVVDRPLTDYLRFEFASYPGTAAAGFETYIADRADDPDLAKLTQDFWFFDDRVVYLMHYDDEGHFLRPERAPDEDVDEYRRQRDFALQHALPLEEYAAKHGDSLTA